MYWQYYVKTASCMFSKSNDYYLYHYSVFFFVVIFRAWQSLDTIHFCCIKSSINILQKTETFTVLEHHEGEQTMTKYKFLKELFLYESEYLVDISGVYINAWFARKTCNAVRWRVYLKGLVDIMFFSAWYESAQTWRPHSQLFFCSSQFG